MAMEHANVRQATMEDYDGVMDIGLFYDGLDYLPSFYKEIIGDPDYRSCVCEVEGEKVAFACALVHDGGTSLQVRSARVKVTHRSHGHLHEMKEWGFRFFVAKNKAARWIISIRFRESDMWKHVDKNTTLLDTINVHLFTVKPGSDYKSSLTPLRLNAGHINDLFDCEAACRRLFPKDLLYVYVVALGVHKSNVRHVINDNTAVFATLSGQDDVEEPTGEILPDRIGLLTIGEIIPIQNGIHYVISVFGDNYDSYDDHVQSHLTIARSRGHSNTYLGILVSEDFPEELLKHTQSNYSTGNPRIWEFATLRSSIVH